MYAYIFFGSSMNALAKRPKIHNRNFGRNKVETFTSVVPQL